MAKTHVTLRFNEQTMFVIQQYQSKHETADRTDAVEGIIADYWKMVNKPLFRIRHALVGDTKTKPLTLYGAEVGAEGCVIHA